MGSTKQAVAGVAKKAVAKKAVAKKAVAKKAVAKKAVATETPIVAFPNARAWAKWLSSNHAESAGIWMKLAKKGSGEASITYAEAVEGALAWGWIDGQKRSGGDAAWLQKFTPRGRKSMWSKINRDKALALIESGAMKPPGLAEVLRAKEDGRWDAAYDSPKTSTIPTDLAAAFAANPRAAAFFGGLDSANRYAVLWRIQTAKTGATRAKRLAELVAKLAKHEKLHG